MKQFCRLESASGNSAAYQAAPCWCPACGGRRLVAEGYSTCLRCAAPRLTALAWSFLGVAHDA
jgi:hypothetical protein